MEQLNLHRGLVWAFLLHSLTIRYQQDYQVLALAHDYSSRSTTDTLLSSSAVQMIPELVEERYRACLLGGVTYSILSLYCIYNSIVNIYVYLFYVSVFTYSIYLIWPPSIGHTCKYTFYAVSLILVVRLLVFCCPFSFILFTFLFRWNCMLVALRVIWTQTHIY